MKVVIFLSLMIMALSAQARNLQNYTGMFEAESHDLRIQVDASRGSLFVRLIEGWNYKINGATYEFDCHRDRCEAYLPELQRGCTIELVLLTSGNILFATTTPSACTGRFLFEPVSHRSPPRGGAWKLGQTVDRSGVLKVHAGIQDRAGRSRFEVACTAPIDDLTLNIGVEDAAWKAIAYDVQVNGHSLRAIVSVDGVEHVMDGWDVSLKNLLSRSARMTNAQIHDLRAGNNLNVELISISPSGDESQLGQFRYSLRGSSVSIEEAQKRCRGESVVPTLLDIFE